MLASLPPKKVEFSGTALGRVAAGSGPGWWYDGDRTTLHVLTPRVMTESETRILIEEDTENNRSAVVNGLPGKIARLNRVMPLLNHLWPLEWSPESLVAVAQTGNRLSIEPSGVGKELGSFEDRWGEVLGEVRAMSIPDSVKERVLHHLLSGQ
jgi:hypothetical protein